jgi:hypothetical protein
MLQDLMLRWDTHLKHKPLIRLRDIHHNKVVTRRKDIRHNKVVILHRDTRHNKVVIRRRPIHRPVRSPNDVEKVSSHSIVLLSQPLEVRPTPPLLSLLVTPVIIRAI